jgi:hypothetical protein
MPAWRTFAARLAKAKKGDRRWQGTSVIVNSILSGLLVVVGVLQWRILSQTDKTLRVGERAFVYIDSVDAAKNNDGSDDKWTFLMNAINNGGTHTKSISFFTICEYGVKSETSPLFTSFLGAKQKIGMGSCVWSEDEVERLWNNNWSFNMTAEIFYTDAFDDSHFTLMCRQILIRSDPKDGASLRLAENRCSETADCTDKECFPTSAPRQRPPTK